MLKSSSVNSARVFKIFQENKVLIYVPCFSNENTVKEIEESKEIKNYRFGVFFKGKIKDSNCFMWQKTSSLRWKKSYISSM